MLVDLTKDKADKLQSTLDGTIAALKRAGPRRRTNWDREQNAAIRARLADAWEDKNDLYEQGESFNKFCTRNGIDRNVLRRFLDNRKRGDPPKKRGRPTLLSEDVMRHLAERKF